MRTTKEMSAGRKTEGVTKLENYNDNTVIVFSTEGKSHNVRLSVSTQEFESKMIAYLKASPRFEARVAELNEALANRNQPAPVPAPAEPAAQ